MDNGDTSCLEDLVTSLELRRDKEDKLLGLD